MATERDDQSEMDDHLAPLQEASLSALSGLALPVRVRIGSTSMTVAELLRLGAGAVITLDRRVDEEVDVLIGDRVVAQGELVSVDEEMGVRITQIVGAGDDGQ
jgi:flagellar motor switch protein FliN/FliY